MTPRTLGVGVVGATSMVAVDAVLPALVASDRTRVVAVASRDATAAAAAAARFGVPHHAGNYQQVLDDPDVDAVYIPLPNGLHRHWTERAAAAGKHVLCEKPLAPTATDAMAMADACSNAGVVLMEAYMTPFHPRAEAAAALVHAGGLGDIRFARAVFSFPLDDPANHRWLPAQGGGALLDVGIYCLTPLVDIGGHPNQVITRAWPSDSGVDSTFTGWLDHPGGFSSTFVCSFEGAERQHLEVVGTRATLTVELPFAGGASGNRGLVHHRDGSVEEVAGDDADPYLAMVDHFADVARGRARSHRPPSASIQLLELFDRLRAAAA
ncbi:MAG: Gfo/Idh/MocA family protein [Acidimicrobiales bacterium]